MAVNCGVEIARLSEAADDHRRPQAGPRRGGAVPRRAPRYSVLDALDNLHRLDREFLRELVVKHKSGLEILAGSDQLRPAGRGRRRRRSRSCSGCSPGSTSTSSSTPAARSTRARSRRSTRPTAIFLVANPDVPSVRNAQRLLERVRAARRVRRARAAAAQPRGRAVSDSARSRSRRRSATRSTTRSRATTRPCRRRSTPACR